MGNKCKTIDIEIDGVGFNKKFLTAIAFSSFIKTGLKVNPLPRCLPIKNGREFTPTPRNSLLDRQRGPRFACSSETHRTEGCGGFSRSLFCIQKKLL